MSYTLVPESGGDVRLDWYLAGDERVVRNEMNQLMAELSGWGQGTDYELEPPRVYRTGRSARALGAWSAAIDLDHDSLGYVLTCNDQFCVPHHFIIMVGLLGNCLTRHVETGLFTVEG